MLVVERDASALFDASAISSFSGKPVTMAHPSGMVGPDSWQNDNAGTVLNPRQGEGAESEYLVADLLVCRKDAIAAVRSGLREISCGYDAQYEQVRPGVGRQVKITGNHVALVDRGRCGPSCAIGDKEMTKRSWADRLRTAFAAKDQKAFDDELEEAQKSGSDGGGGGEGAHHPVVVHINQTGVGTKKPEGDDEEDEDMATKDVAKTLDSLAKTVTDGLKTVNDSLKAFDERLKKVETKDADEEETEAEKEARLKKEKAEKEETKDSLELAGIWRDVVSRSEMLAPGGNRGVTFDAKAKFSATNDAVCKMRRDAMHRAVADAKRKSFVDRAFGGSTNYNLDTISCEALVPAFIAASEFARDAANNGVYKDPVITVNNGGNGPMTAARLQEINVRSRGVAEKK